MEDKAPSFCRLCNIPLASPNVWRQHAKSDWHVYNLRVRVAEPGAIVPPPSALQRAEPVVDAERDAQSDEEGDDLGDGDTELSEEPEFKSGQCLFCGAESTSFDDNLAHMSKAHSFAIPHQDQLTVDVYTLVRYLHLVIYGYGECVLCATHRSTVEGIQHHMSAKGHCRFNISSDIAEFYAMPSPDYRADEDSLRLPSGKLLRHRRRAPRPAASRIARHSAERRLEPTMPPASQLDLVATHDDPPVGSSSSTQLSRLTQGDRQSLAHLADHEVRSLLARSAREMDQSRREEKHAHLKLGNAGNITLTAHFRADTSKRFRGPWG